MPQDSSATPPKPGVSLDRWLLLICLCCVGLAYYDLKTDLREVNARLDAATSEDDQPLEQVEPAQRAEPEPPQAAELPEPQTIGTAAAQWACSETIPTEKVRSAIGANGPDVFRCYSRALKSRPALAGTLHLELKVNAAGVVEDARARGTLNDAELLSCLGGKVFDWRFDGPAKGCAVVSAPFQLDPSVVIKGL